MNLRLLVRSSLLLLLAIGVLTGDIAAQETSASGTFTGVVDVFNASVLVSSGVVFDISGVQVDEHFTLRTGIPVEVSFTVSRGILTATRPDQPPAHPGHGSAPRRSGSRLRKHLRHQRPELRRQRRQNRG
ncbi:MAG: hypothetical protein HND48_23855 [Chloroflexi bacterium]|nr:hypothetical protein [Chloroflexota bacterium]